MAHLFNLLCILCLHFTCTHCVGVCGRIGANLDSILAIGPWNPSHLTVLTTDLQLLQGTMTEKGSDQSTLRLKLTSPGSLSSSEPKLYDILHKQALTSSVNLIEIEYNQGRRFLLQNQASTWQIDPSSGQQDTISDDPALGGVWYSTDTNNWSKFDGMVISNFYLTGNEIKTGVVKYLDNSVDGFVKVTASKPAKPSKKWPVKKAFHWNGNLYFLTSETVYIFSDDALTSKETRVKLTKVRYGDFFVCNVTKAGENAKNDVSSYGKDGGRHAKGSSKPSGTPWLLIGILLLVGGLIIGLAVFYLRRGQSKSSRVESTGHLKDGSAYRSRKTAASSGHGRAGSPHHHGSANRHRHGSGHRKTPHTKKKAHSPVGGGTGTMILGPTAKPSPTKTTLHGPRTIGLGHSVTKASKTTLISPRASKLAGKNGKSTVKANSSSFQKIATRWNTTIVK